jgi:hypothetical protein
MTSLNVKLEMYVKKTAIILLIAAKSIAIVENLLIP